MLMEVRRKCTLILWDLVERGLQRYVTLFRSFKLDIFPEDASPASHADICSEQY
jgi:hypothetical protein